MENPEHEIRSVVRSLCQGTPDEQRRTLDRYFTSDVSFVHPFCTVPHFSKSIPILGRLSSRDVVRSIFQWYRMLSPRIDIEIDSALHDKLRDKIYLDMRQTFSIWFIPMYHAHVRLVTVLDLVDSDSPDYHDPLDRMLKQEEEREGGATNGASQPHRNGSRNNNHHNHRHNGSRSSNHHHHHKHGSCTWKISKQEDLYQVTDFLKFAGGPGPFPFLWYLFQLGASAACVFLSLLLLATPWAFQKEPARGGVEATVECVESPTSPTSTLSGDQETEGADDPDAADNSGSRNRELGGGDSVPEKGPSHVNHGSASGGPVGGNADGGSNDNNNDNNNKSNSDNNHNNGTNHPSTNGHRRESSNSKVSSSGPKKSRKNANNGKKKAAAA